MAKNVQQSAASAFFSPVTSLDNNIQQLSVADITLHPHNTAAAKDTAESVQELADSIRVNGLIHPLAINHIGGEYRLLSGERRYKAIVTHLHWDTVPCTVYENLTPAEEKLVLVSANLQAREYSAGDKLELYLQALDAVETLKAQGDYTGSTQQALSTLLNVSTRQIRKYSQVVENVGRANVSSVKSIKTETEHIRREKQKAEPGSAFENEEVDFLYKAYRVLSTPRAKEIPEEMHIALSEIVDQLQMLCQEYKE